MDCELLFNIVFSKDNQENRSIFSTLKYTFHLRIDSAVINLTKQ